MLIKQISGIFLLGITCTYNKGTKFDYILWILFAYINFCLRVYKTNSKNVLYNYEIFWKFDILSILHFTKVFNLRQTFFSE